MKILTPISELKRGDKVLFSDHQFVVTPIEAGRVFGELQYTLVNVATGEPLYLKGSKEVQWLETNRSGYSTYRLPH